MYIINSTILIVWQANTPDLTTTDFSTKKSTYSANYLDIFLKVVENTFTSFILRFTHGKKTCVRFVQKYQINCDYEKYIIPLIKHMNDSFSKGGQQTLDFL